MFPRRQMSAFGCVGRKLRNSSPWLLRGALKETLGCRARSRCPGRGGKPRTSVRAHLSTPAFGRLPTNARSQAVPKLSGRATSTERPLVSSALYPRAQSKREKPWPREGQARPPLARPGWTAASTARTRRSHWPRARARAARGLDPGSWGAARGRRRGLPTAWARDVRAREGAGGGGGAAPPAPRRGLSRPMSGVHMPRRRREGRQRRINAIRAASAEPSPTPPPPVSSAAVPSAAAVGGAELRGSGRRAAQLLSRRLPCASPRRGLGRAPLLSCARSPRRSARGLHCPRPAGSS